MTILLLLNIELLITGPYNFIESFYICFIMLRDESGCLFATYARLLPPMLSSGKHLKHCMAYTTQG